MVTYNTIIQELNKLPIERLPEVYDYLHSLNMDEGTTKSKNPEIISFSGIFSEMSDKEYEDFKSETIKVRKELFNRNINI